MGRELSYGHNGVVEVKEALVRKQQGTKTTLNETLVIPYNNSKKCKKKHSPCFRAFAFAETR